MDLWVRSQDKETIIKVKGITYYHNTKTGHFIVSNGIDLGRYDSKERCLEIIDEIQKILIADPAPMLVFTNCDIAEDTYNGLNMAYKNRDLLTLCASSYGGEVKVLEKSSVVYQMPEK